MLIFHEVLYSVLGTYFTLGGYELLDVLYTEILVFYMSRFFFQIYLPCV